MKYKRILVDTITDYTTFKHVFMDKGIFTVEQFHHENRYSESFLRSEIHWSNKHMR